MSCLSVLNGNGAFLEISTRRVVYKDGKPEVSWTELLDCRMLLDGLVSQPEDVFEYRIRIVDEDRKLR